MEEHHSTIQNHLNAIRNKVSDLTKQCIIKGIIVVQQSRGESSPGSEASVQLYSCSHIDPSKLTANNSLLLKHRSRKIW